MMIWEWTNSINDSQKAGNLFWHYPKLFSAVEKAGLWILAPGASCCEHIGCLEVIPFVLMLSARWVANSLLECPLVRFRVILSAQFSSQFGMFISQLDDNNLERNEYQWQQWNLAPRIDEVNVNLRINRLRNCFSEPCEPNSENLTVCLQRYNPWIWKETKNSDVDCKQQGVINNSQKA
jgi:hypothetical protein